MRQALSHGATWEAVGDALGTTRQAAWARFRHVVEAGGGLAMERQGELRDQAAAIRERAQLRLRELDDQWRQETARLDSELQEVGGRLRDARHTHRRQRRDVRDDLRRSLHALVAERTESRSATPRSDRDDRGS